MALGRWPTRPAWSAIGFLPASDAEEGEREAVGKQGRRGGGGVEKQRESESFWGFDLFWVGFISCMSVLGLGMSVWVFFFFSGYSY